MSPETIRRWLSMALSAVGWVATALWVAGIVLHDRWGWSQWLSWIPAPAVAAGLLIVAALRLALGVGRAVRSATRFVALSVAAIGWTVHTSVGWSPEVVGRDQSVRLLQWNTDWPSADDPRSAAALAEAPADVVLNSNHGRILSREAVAAWAPEGARAFFAGPFALVTAWPVVEARLVAAGGGARQGWFIARFTVLPPGWAGRALRIAMVDLPSRPTLAKREVAAAVVQACEAGDLGEVDVVAGDFNAIDGSVILDGCFPAHRDALADAGRGWLCTWPRAFPLWKIDHVLLGPHVQAMEACVIDPRTSHHRMTRVDIEPR